MDEGEAQSLASQTQRPFTKQVKYRERSTGAIRRRPCRHDKSESLVEVDGRFVLLVDVYSQRLARHVLGMGHECAAYSVPAKIRIDEEAFDRVRRVAEKSDATPVG